jgi:hypothetical protein
MSTHPCTVNATRVKRGFTGITFTGTLTSTNALDWTGATVRFVMQHQVNRNITITGDATFTGDWGTGTEGSSTTAGVAYTVASDDLAEEGTYDQDWQVTLDSGGTIPFPSDRHNAVVIIRSLG